MYVCVCVYMQQLQLMMFALLSVFEADGARQKMEKKTD